MWFAESGLNLTQQMLALDSMVITDECWLVVQIFTASR